MKRLAIITTHPIQYNAPWFKLLNETGKIAVKVFYTWGRAGMGAKYDPGFGKVIEWDIPLLEGYDYEYVDNISNEPGSHHFKGIINPDLIERIQAWKPDALLVFGWSFDSHLRCLRFFYKKVPVLFRGDSTLLDEKVGIRQLIRRFFLRWVFSHVDFALYAGTNNKMYFRKHGLKEHQLVFVPHAIDNERFCNNPEVNEQKARDWRKRLNINDSDLVVLFAGKFESKKNPELLLKVASEIPNKDIRFILVGNGHLDSTLKNAANGDPRIHFLDFQNQNLMPVVYRLGDVFILPSNGPGETWGLAVNEAMASSRTIMVSDKVGCGVDLVSHKNGIIFPHGKHVECVSFLTALLENRKKLAEMNRESEKRITDFSYERIVRAVLNILDTLKTKD
ncbi:hypothetical protein A3860_00505 [Niastella vici]|uniref:Glycosyl transferase family 1 domain-containing protein n=1 Tax=Niastella vici TaxID=1703345 RepID=A0A1V9G8L0_9BACT|nr:glycosyltransferase family 4 protein [Niastella vici]OQP66884.1 hypothetical protein A3860_00505 [Niastella vici]